MKREFNKKNSIAVTDKDGVLHNILKADIYKVEPNDARNEKGPAKIIFRKREGEPDREPLITMEDAETVAGRINGRPEPSTIDEWSAEIIRARRNSTADKIASMVRANAADNADDELRFSRREASLQDKITASQTALEENSIKIGGSYRSRLARTLFDFSRKPNEMPFLTDAANIAVGIIASDKIALFAREGAIQGSIALSQERVEAFRRGVEQEKQRKREEYNREMRRLESVRDDPQMRHEDRMVLNKKINDYREGHQIPEFVFTREFNGSYRTMDDVARERGSPVIIKRQDRDRDDDRVIRRGPSRSRSRGMER